MLPPTEVGLTVMVNPFDVAGLLMAQGVINEVISTVIKS